MLKYPIIFLIFFLSIFSNTYSQIEQIIENNPAPQWGTLQYDLRHTGRCPYIGPEKPKLLWKYETCDAICTPISISADGTIYTGSDDGNLYAIHPNGTLQWSFKGDNWMRSFPALSSDGTIYIGSRDNYFYSIYPDGSLKWKYETGN
jgi:outer membrane protein assembly factor BamB